MPRSSALALGTCVLSLLLASPAPAAERAPVALARDGSALVSVRIAPGASAALRASASNLTAVLSRIAGAEFALTEGGDAAGITLGTLDQFPDAAVAEALASRGGIGGKEAFAIRTGPGGVRLLAQTDLGAGHAAARFLELLGYRLFFQGPAWEVIPSTPDLRFGADETSWPDIASRSIWFSRTAQAWEKGDPDANAAFARWAWANRLGRSLDFNASHAWHAIPTAYKDDGYPYRKTFEEHPEYFALVKGKRTPPQLCVSNPDLRQLVVSYANRYFEKNPDEDMVSLDPADQGGWCECEACAALGPYPCQPFALANAVAAELQRTHPGKFVGLLAYSWHSDAPPFALETNVYVQLTAGMNASTNSFDSLFGQWTATCRNLGIYEYFSYWEMGECMLPGEGPQNDFDALGPRIRHYVSNGVASISAQAASSWGASGLGYYLAARLMWDSSLDAKALRRDFYDKAFGPAAAPMERCYERLNRAAIPLPGAALLRQCLADLEEAAALAAGRPDVLARLTELKENLVYNGIGLKVKTGGGAAREDNLLDWFTWSYRTRTNYMYDWISFRSSVGRPAAEEMGLTNWFWRNTRDNPWRVDTPVTAEELEGRLRTFKAEWGELPAAPERRFSARFVLAATDQPGAGDRHQLHSGTAVYLVASTNGEPLRVTVTKRPTGWMEKPDARFSLESQDGATVTNGRFATGTHELELRVPGPGIYRFTGSRGGKGWEIDFPESMPRALVFARGVHCNPAALRDAWFYVPKGTSEIVMYSHPPSSPVILGPDKRVARKGTSDGRYVPIAVKPGEDGRLWRVTGRPSNLWFFNVPTLLNFHAGTIIVPEDVAEADGLPVILR